MNDFLQSLRNGQTEKPRTPKTRKSYDNAYHYTSQPRFHSYNNGYQNSRSQHMKRPPAQHQNGNQIPMDEASALSILAEAVDNLSSYIETLAKNQDYLINTQERAADMLERQAIALERIIDHLDIAPESTIESDNEIEQDPGAGNRQFEHHYVTSRGRESDITEPIESSVEPTKEYADSEKPVVKKRKKILTETENSASTEKQILLSREEVMDIIHTMRADGATFDQVASRLIELGQPTFSGRGEWHAQTIHRLCNKR